MKPETALEVAGRALLVGVCAQQRRVEVDLDQPRPRAAPPRPRPGLRARRPDRLQRARVGGDPLDQPIRRRVRRHRPEQRLLLAHRPQVAQRVAAVGQHHRQIPDHAPRRVRRRALEQLPQRAIERARQPEPIGGLGDQPRAGVRHQTLSVRPDLYLHIAPTAPHPQGDLLNRDPRPSASRRIPAQPDNTAPRIPGARPVNERSGLGRSPTPATIGYFDRVERRITARGARHITPGPPL